VLSTTRNQAYLSGGQKVRNAFFEIWISSEIFEKCFSRVPSHDSEPCEIAIFSLDDRKQCAKRVYALVSDIQPKACIH